MDCSGRVSSIGSFSSGEQVRPARKNGRMSIGVKNGFASSSTGVRRPELQSRSQAASLAYSPAMSPAWLSHLRPQSAEKGRDGEGEEGEGVQPCKTLHLPGAQTGAKADRALWQPCKVLKTRQTTEARTELITSCWGRHRPRVFSWKGSSRHTRSLRYISDTAALMQHAQLCFAKIRRAQTPNSVFSLIFRPPPLSPPPAPPHVTTCSLSFDVS